MIHCNGRCCRNSITASGCWCVCDTCDPDGETDRQRRAAIGDEGMRIARVKQTELAAALGWGPQNSWDPMLEMVKSLVPLPGVIESMRKR